MEMDDAIPSSQIVNGSTPIFHDASGSPLEIFVDPGAVSGRPKLVRSLHKLGANICVAVAEAQLILVDSDTRPGRQFIRDWGRDRSKALLEYVWARKSIEAGKALLENDDWGGCLAVDDGFKSDEDEDDEEISRPVRKSPLPTPRPTPTESRRSPPARLRSVSPRPSSSHVDHRDTGRKGLEPQPSHENAYLNSYPAANGAAQMLQFPQLQPIQSLPMSQPTHPNVGLPFPQSQMPYGGMPTMQQALVNHVPQPAPIDAQTMMSVMDVIKHQGINPQAFFNQMFMTTPHPSFTQNNMLPPMFMPQSQPNGVPQSTHGVRPPDPYQTDSPMAAGVIATPSGTPTASPSSQNFPPSGRRGSPVASTAPSRSKGKEREPSLSRARREDSSSTIATSKSSRLSISAHIDFTTPEPCTRGSPRPPGLVFTSRSGEPLSFFVQVDLSNRLAVVNKVKKNGGRIESDNMVANYVILDSAKGKDFTSLLSSTIAANKSAMRAGFVHDCVEQGSLLDSTEYIFDEPAMQKQKRIRSSVSKTPSPSKAKAKEKVVGKKDGGGKKAKKPQMGGDGQTPHSGPPSPPPPAENTRRPFGAGGKFFYSEDEKKYFMRYVKILYKRNPFITNGNIAQRMHEKMPTHTVASWRQYMSQSVSGELDHLRKDYRRASQNGQNEESPSKRARHSITQAKDAEPIFDPEAANRDFEVICKYFSSGEDAYGGDDDEEVWAELTRRTPCRSAPSWPVFYAQNIDKVNDEIERQLLSKLPSESGFLSSQPNMGSHT